MANLIGSNKVHNFGQVVMFVTSIQEIPTLGIVQDTDYPD